MDAFISYGMEPFPPPRGTSQPPNSTQPAETVPEHLKRFIGKVRVFHASIDNPRTFVGIYSDKVLCSVSTAAQEKLPKQDGNRPPKALLVSNVDKDQLYYVLTAATHYGNKLRLNMVGRPMPEVVEILHVVETLGIKPPQGVEGHLVGLLSHFPSPLPVAIMIKVHKYFGHKTHDSRPWRVMVHQMAYDIVHDKLAGEQLRDTETAASSHPDLHRAINNRRQELIVCLRHKENEAMRREANMQHRHFVNHSKTAAEYPGRNQSTKQPKRKKKSSSPATQQLYDDKEERKRVDEKNGLGETSSRTTEYVMHEKPTEFWVTSKMSQREKKAAQHAVGETKADGDETGDLGDLEVIVNTEQVDMGNRFGALAL